MFFGTPPYMASPEYGAAAPASCKRFQAARKAALKQMWRYPLLTKKRKVFHQRADYYAKMYAACVKRARTAGRGGAARPPAPMPMLYPAPIRKGPRPAGPAPYMPPPPQQPNGAFQTYTNSEFDPSSPGVQAANMISPADAAAFPEAQVSAEAEASMSSSGVSPWLIGGLVVAGIAAYAYSKRKSGGTSRSVSFSSAKSGSGVRSF